MVNISLDTHETTCKNRAKVKLSSGEILHLKCSNDSHLDLNSDPRKGPILGWCLSHYLLQQHPVAVLQRIYQNW